MNLENQLPIKELEQIGLMKNGELLMDQSNATALLRGNVTDLLEIKNIEGNGVKIETMDARVSVVNENGESKLRVDPVYKDIQDHPLLEEDEKINLVNEDIPNVKKTIAMSGTIINFGADNYQFQKDAKASYFIEVAKGDGSTRHVWGVDLKRALEESGFKIGDRVKLNNLGSQKVEVDIPIKDENGVTTSYEKKMVDRNTWEVKELTQEELKEKEQTIDKKQVIEYDKQTRQFMHYDPAKIKAPEGVNGETLTPEQKRKLKEGDVIKLKDGTELQLATSDKNGVRSNRRALVLSVLLDGGISYLLITGIKSLLNRGNKNAVNVQARNDEHFSRGYLTALKQVEIQLERKQAKFPNDKSIGEELSLVKGEFSKASNMSPADFNNLSVKDADDIKSEQSVNDPDHGMTTPSEVKPEIKKETIVTESNDVDPKRQLSEIELREVLSTVPYIAGAWPKSAHSREILDFLKQASEEGNVEKKEVYSQALSAINEAENKSPNVKVDNVQEVNNEQQQSTGRGR
jgi:hypothetical protein